MESMAYHVPAWGRMVATMTARRLLAVVAVLALTAATAAALYGALTVTMAEAAPAGPAHGRLSPFSNGGTGACLPNAGNWGIHHGSTNADWAETEWTSRPGGCWLQTKGQFRRPDSSTYVKYSGAVTSLNLWTRVTADTTSDVIIGQWYHWRHCDGPGETGCGSWSSLHAFG